LDLSAATRPGTYAAERERLASPPTTAVGGPPTAELLHPIGPEVPDDRHVQQVIDLCIRIGEVLLSSGEGSGETTETMLRVANAFGLSAVDVDITFTAVTICCHRSTATRHCSRCCSPHSPGGAGRGTYVLLTAYGAGPVAAAGVAATVVGLAAGLLRRAGRVPWEKVPPLVVTLAGNSPLLPGLTAYRGFYELSVEGLTDGLVTLTLALAIGLALAAGVTLGQYLTRPQATPLSPADPAPAGTRN
jgi:uncharacterized membrane protein YjjB (DUF3815 family)